MFSGKTSCGVTINVLQRTPVFTDGTFLIMLIGHPNYQGYPVCKGIGLFTVVGGMCCVVCCYCLLCCVLLLFVVVCCYVLSFLCFCRVAQCYCELLLLFVASFIVGFCMLLLLFLFCLLLLFAAVVCCCVSVCCPFCHMDIQLLILLFSAPFNRCYSIMEGKFVKDVNLIDVSKAENPKWQTISLANTGKNSTELCTLNG